MKRRIFGCILIAVGIIIIGYAVYSRHSAEKEQKALIESFEKTLKEMGQDDFLPGTINSNGEEDSVAQPEETPVIANSNAMAILEIPKIDLVVAVVEGTEPKDLKYAVGHFRNTAKPGEKGNFCVAGHRSYTYNQYFNRLDELENGDIVRVRTEKGEYEYEISDKVVVEPTEVSVLKQTEEATITLVTCTPIRVATHRLIIKGKLKKQ